MTKVRGQALLRVGTRGSRLALAQAEEVCNLLSKAHGVDRHAIEIKIIKTTGDQVQDRPLSNMGGKGLFTKEIEIALAAGEIDLAVHSAKDMPTVLPDGLTIAACPQRQDPRDALISQKATALKNLPWGASLGTASLRREAQARRLRSDLNVRPLRGSVETRLRKLAAGEIDAMILGMAGLNRLGLAGIATQVLSTDEFLPAVGQGAIAIEARTADERVHELLSAINHMPTSVALTAERAFLSVLEGSCRTPIGGYAVVSGSDIAFRGAVLCPDGSRIYEVRCAGAADLAREVGADAGAQMKHRVSGDFVTRSTATAMQNAV
jgi:hydroxymethylbilane synthase